MIRWAWSRAAALSASNVPVGGSRSDIEAWAVPKKTAVRLRENKFYTYKWRGYFNQLPIPANHLVAQACMSSTYSCNRSRRRKIGDRSSCIGHIFYNEEKHLRRSALGSQIVRRPALFFAS